MLLCKPHVTSVPTIVHHFCNVLTYMLTSKACLLIHSLLLSITSISNTEVKMTKIPGCLHTVHTTMRTPHMVNLLQMTMNTTFILFLDLAILKTCSSPLETTTTMRLKHTSYLYFQLPTLLSDFTCRTYPTLTRSYAWFNVRSTTQRKYVYCQVSWKKAGCIHTTFMDALSYAFQKSRCYSRLP